STSIWIKTVDFSRSASARASASGSAGARTVPARRRARSYRAPRSTTIWKRPSSGKSLVTACTWAGWTSTPLIFRMAPAWPAQRRRERLGGREADPVVEVAAGVEAHLARRVAEVGEEARRAGVHRRAPGARHLHLEAARPGAAVDDQAAVLLEGAMEPDSARHDVVGQGHVHHLAGAHTHGGDRLDEHRRPAALLGEARDVDRPGRGVERGELLPRRGEKLA